MTSQYWSLAAFLLCLAGLSVWFSNGILIADILLAENIYEIATNRIRRLIITMRVAPSLIMVLLAFMMGFTFNDIYHQDLPKKIYQVLIIHSELSAIGDMYARVGIKSKPGI